MMIVLVYFYILISSAKLDFPSAVCSSFLAALFLIHGPAGSPEKKACKTSAKKLEKPVFIHNLVSATIF